MTSSEPLPVVLLGASWCEDTALVRSRLRALGVPFEERDVESDPAAGERIRALNGGAQVTPTLVFGDEASVEAEPTLERLGELLSAAGWRANPPTATHYHGTLTERAVPMHPAPTTLSGAKTLPALRGRQEVALFLAHEPACLACFGYARQLAAHRKAQLDADTVLLIVVPGDRAGVGEWRDGLEGVTLAADPDGAWKRTVAARIGAPADDPILLLLDRYLAPRAGSVATEAGGLIDPSDAARWLEFFSLDCPECSGELPWPLTAAD